MERLDAFAPLGVFDSGVGGLSVLSAIWAELPEEDALYLADQANVPYGPRPLEEVRDFAKGITRFLLAEGAKLIVVACNAASAAALHHLRQEFPSVPFVGMEPAVKPATELTNSGVVGVLGTPATFQGELYASVVERFANNVELIQHTCPGLVPLIEDGQIDSQEARKILQGALMPMLARGIDTVVLGCTHYPFVIPIIKELVGPDVRVIDPSPAIARQVRRILSARGLLKPNSRLINIQSPGQGEIPDQSQYPNTRFLTSGDPLRLAGSIEQLLGLKAEVTALQWEELCLSSLSS